MGRDITGLTGCLGKMEKFLFSILSLIIYPYAPSFKVHWKNQELHNKALFRVTFLKPTWLLILGYCQKTGLPICDNNQVYLEWTRPKPVARLQTRANKLCPGPSHLAYNHLHSLIPQPSADLRTQLPARSRKERHILSCLSWCPTRFRTFMISKGWIVCSLALLNLIFLINCFIEW